jgi:hypothetical protein
MTIWLVIFKNSLPESIAASMMLWMGIESLNPPLVCLLVIGCCLLLRFVWNLAILIHGLGHVLVAAIVEGVFCQHLQPPRRNIYRLKPHRLPPQYPSQRHHP